MKWFKFKDPTGQDWYIQARDAASALALAKQRLGERGYGATDVYKTQLDGEVPNFNPSDPAYGGRVYAATGTGSGSTADPVIDPDPDPDPELTTIDDERNRKEAISRVEQTSPYAGYLAGAKPRYGDITGSGAYNRFLRGQGEGAQATFMGREALGMNESNPVDDPDRLGPFQRYAANNLNQGTGFSGQANQAFRDIRAGGGSTAAPDAIAGYTNPADFTGAQAGFNLARQARKGRFSSMLDRFMPDDYDLYNSWLGETGGTGATPAGNNWFDYLQKRLGVLGGGQ